jgi:hypothetical protein
MLVSFPVKETVYAHSLSLKRRVQRKVYNSQTLAHSPSQESLPVGLINIHHLQLQATPKLLLQILILVFSFCFAMTSVREKQNDHFGTPFAYTNC